MYGVMIDHMPMQIVNSVGSVLFAGYTIVFFRYSKKKILVVRQAGVAAMLFFVLAMVLLQINASQDAIKNLGHRDNVDSWLEEKTFLGMVGAILSMTFCASPLASVQQVFIASFANLCSFSCMCNHFRCSIRRPRSPYPFS